MASVAIFPQRVTRAKSEQLRCLNQGADFSFAVHAGYGLSEIYVEGLNANAVTLRIGTTDTGSDVVASQTVPNPGTGFVTGANILKRYFSRTLNQVIYVTSAAWGGAAVNLTLVLDKVAP